MLIKIEATDGSPVFVNPAHVVCVAPLLEEGQPMIGRCALLLTGATLNVKGSPEEVARLLRGAPELRESIG